MQTDSGEIKPHWEGEPEPEDWHRSKDYEDHEALIRMVRHYARQDSVTKRILPMPDEVAREFWEGQPPFSLLVLSTYEVLRADVGDSGPSVHQLRRY